jgi:hypothetical protein
VTFRWCSLDHGTKAKPHESCRNYSPPNGKAGLQRPFRVSVYLFVQAAAVLADDLIGFRRDRSEAVLLFAPRRPYRMSPLLAQSGHAGQRQSRQLSGVKRTRPSSAAAAANDPKRTSPSLPLCGNIMLIPAQFRRAQCSPRSALCDDNDPRMWSAEPFGRPLNGYNVC